MDDFGILCFGPYSEADFSGEESGEMELLQSGRCSANGHAFFDGLS